MFTRKIAYGDQWGKIQEPHMFNGRLQGSPGYRDRHRRSDLAAIDVRTSAQMGAKGLSRVRIGFLYNTKCQKNSLS